MANTQSDQGEGSIHLGCLEAAAHVAETPSMFNGILDCRGDVWKLYNYNVDEMRYRQITVDRYTWLRAAGDGGGKRLEPVHKGDVFSYVGQG